MSNMTASAAETPPEHHARRSALWAATARVGPCASCSAKAVALDLKSADLTTRLTTPHRAISSADIRAEVRTHSIAFARPNVLSQSIEPAEECHKAHRLLGLPELGGLGRKDHI